MRSSAGVGITPPKVLGAAKPTSSVMMRRMLGAPLGGTIRGAHHGLDWEALRLIVPPNFGCGFGRYLPSMVVVALGDPGAAFFPSSAPSSDETLPVAASQPSRAPKARTATIWTLVLRSIARLQSSDSADPHGEPPQRRDTTGSPCVRLDTRMCARHLTPATAPRPVAASGKDR